MTHPLHEKAIQLSKTYLTSERHLVEVLGEIDAQKIWRTLGYPSFFAYASKGLGLSDAQAYSLTSISRKCREVPELKTAIICKGVSLSNAKRILPVLTRETADKWIQKAETLSTRILEKEVAAVSPRTTVKEGVRPISANLSKMTLCLTGETEAMFKRAQDLLSKNNRSSLSLEETLRAMAELVIDKFDKVAKAERSALAKVRRISKSSYNSTIGKASTRRYTRYIPNEVRHQVMLRDKGECQAKLPGGALCNGSRFTEIHHIKSVSMGGIHHVSNLITLCSAHHKRLHEMDGNLWRWDFDCQSTKKGGWVGDIGWSQFELKKDLGSLK